MAVEQATYLRARLPDHAAAFGGLQRAALAFAIDRVHVFALDALVHGVELFGRDGQHVQPTALSATSAIGVTVIAVEAQRLVVRGDFHGLPSDGTHEWDSSFIR